ncbi:MAG TPA: 4-(cytidine 5'-diphospho)-2-C-methyl-D-erythritol kinase, partial [Chloroflexota bacterium]
MEVTARAFAKVNLVLEVLGKRPDGYHEVATVLQTISVHDEVRARSADDLALGACGDIPPRD